MKFIFALLLLVATAGNGQTPTSAQKRLLNNYWDSTQAHFDKMMCLWKLNLDDGKEWKKWWYWDRKWHNLFLRLYPEYRIVRNPCNCPCQ